MFPKGDPFHKPSKGGQLYSKDYTKFVRWTPLKITIAALCIAIPYFGVVAVIASVVSIGAVIPLLILPLALMVMVGLVYGIGFLGRPRRLRQPKRNRRRR